MFPTLYQNLSNNNLIDTDGNIVLETYENGSVQFVDKNTFETFFGDCQTNPSYESFCGSHTFVWHDISVTRTADELGYKIFFDQWHDKGII